MEQINKPEELQVADFVRGTRGVFMPVIAGKISAAASLIETQYAKIQEIEGQRTQELRAYELTVSNFRAKVEELEAKLAATKSAANRTAPKELIDAANKVGRWLQIAPHDKESTEAIDDAICLLVDHVVLNDSVASRFHEALTSIQRYGFDTLSGRDDGVDDRNWQRQAVQEMARRATEALAATQPAAQQFQARVGQWLMECFGHDIAHDGMERNHRFLEEALELVQSLGCTDSEAHQLVDYVFGRPVGEPVQELGGVMVTLAALCFAHELDMAAGADKELVRICDPATMAKIKAKQAAKPRHSPLPQPAAQGLDAKAMSEWLLARRSHLGSSRESAHWGKKCWDNYTMLSKYFAAQAKQGGE